MDVNRSMKFRDVFILNAFIKKYKHGAEIDYDTDEMKDAKSKIEGIAHTLDTKADKKEKELENMKKEYNIMLKEIALFEGLEEIVNSYDIKNKEEEE